MLQGLKRGCLLLYNLDIRDKGWATKRIGRVLLLRKADVSMEMKSYPWDGNPEKVGRKSDYPKNAGSD